MNTRALFLAVFLIGAGGNLALAEQPHAVIAQVDEVGLGLAESLLNQNRPDEAEKLAVRALEADPNSLEARLVLAKVEIMRGDLEKAQLYATQLFELDPDEPDHHALQGMIFLFQDRFEQAVTSLNDALRLGAEKGYSEGQLASYANTLVLTYHRAGDSRTALKVCLQALEDYPEDPDLHLVCSRLFREAENYQAALEVAQQGLKSRPDFPGLYASVALAQQGLGNREASEKALQEVQRRDPGLAEALRQTMNGTRPDDPEYKLRTN